MALLTEAPDKIGSLGTFEHCSIDYEYDNVNELSPPGVYYIWPKGGKAHNYSFVYLGAELHINKTKAEIIIINDEVYSTYTPDVMAQTVNEYVDGEYDPLAAYIYTADDTSKVDIVVVGYAFGQQLRFFLHFKTVVDEEGNTVDIFYPKIVFHNGEWVPYEESLRRHKGLQSFFFLYRSQKCGAIYTQIVRERHKLFESYRKIRKII